MRDICRKMQLQMSLPSFVLNDETVYTSHGFYLLNSGARFDRFRSNPVMLDNHCDDRVIGRWKDLRVEGAQLIATPDFDNGSELGKERLRQVERGYLRGASLGIYIESAEERVDPNTGAIRLYVTEWEPLEASIVAIPSNAGAVALRVYDADRRPIGDDKLESHLGKIVKLSKSNKSMTNAQANTGAEAPVHVTLSAQAQIALGLSESAPVAEVSAAVVKLAAELKEAKEKFAQLTRTVEDQKRLQAEALVDLAIEEGRITADRRDAFVKLASTDYEAAKSTLEAIQGRQSLAAQIRTAAGGESIPTERKTWSLSRWMREDMSGLKRLKKDDPASYAEILKHV